MKNVIIIATICLTSLSFADKGKEAGKMLPQFILEKFDTDGDGTLDATERGALKDARKEWREERKAFRKSFDHDGDGQLSETERDDLKVAREKKLIEHFDTDGDGVLNAGEQKVVEKMRAFRKRMKNRHYDCKGGKKSQGEGVESSESAAGTLN